MGNCICAKNWCKQITTNDNKLDNPTNLHDLENALYTVSFEDLTEEQYTFTKAKVLKVYDGDTYWIGAIHNNQLMKFKIRLYGVDTPELRGSSAVVKEQAIESKNYVIQLMLGRVVDIQILNNTIYDGRKITEKYGRLLAIIHVNGINLAEDLIEKGYGVQYYGGTKTGV